MPLLAPVLAHALEKLFVKSAPSLVVSAQQMANAYDDYCQAALFGANRPVLLPSARTLLQSSLLAAMRPLGTPLDLSQAWSQGIQAYWLAPPVQVTGAQIGVVTAIPGAPGVVPQLIQIFSNPLNSAKTASVQVAAILDTATRTCVATVAPPPGTILPIL